MTDDSACSHVVVAYDILTTHRSSLGHESSLSLSKPSQCCQFESRKLPEFFELSLCQNFIAKMSDLFYELPVTSNLLKISSY